MFELDTSTRYYDTSTWPYGFPRSGSTAMPSYFSEPIYHWSYDLRLPARPKSWRWFDKFRLPLDHPPPKFRSCGVRAYPPLLLHCDQISVRRHKRRLAVHRLRRGWLSQCSN